MTIYIVELILIWLFGMLLYNRNISKKIFAVLSFTMMALVLGLRGASVGEDTQHFIDIFNYAKNVSWKTVFTSGTDVIYNTVWSADLSVETGYMILNKVVGIFTDNGQWLIFIVAVLTCWLFAKFILDNCENVFFATYIFMCESLYMFAFNGMRQMLALAVALQAYRLIKERRIKATIVMFLLALLIHKSVIVLLVMIPFAMITKRQKALKWVFIVDAVLIVSITALRLAVSYLIPRYESYFTTNYWNSTLGFGSTMLLLVEAVICIYMYYRGFVKDGTDEFMAVSGTSLVIALEIMGLQVVMFERIAMLFKPFLFFLFPMATRYFARGSKKYYQGIVMLVLTLCFLSYASSDARIYSFFW